MVHDTSDDGLNPMALQKALKYWSFTEEISAL